MPQCTQAPHGYGCMTNANIRAAHRALAQLINTEAHVITNHVVFQANLAVGPQHNTSTPTSRIWDFMGIDPPTFHGPTVDEDPQGFIDEVFMLVDAMGVTTIANAN